MSNVEISHAIKRKMSSGGFVSKLDQMNDLRSYSRQWVKEFIELYRSEICLWKAKHADYNNTVLRNKAYDKLVEKLKEVEPNPNRSTALRKINSLRSAFRREHRKKKQYRDYEPRLWYFDILSFIADQKYPATRKCFQKQTDSDSNDDGDGSIYDGQNSTTDDKASLHTIIIHSPQPEIFEESTIQVRKEEPKSTIISDQLDNVSVKLADFQPKQESVMQMRGIKHDDEYDAIGVNVASKLRNMKPTQRIIAEKLISDVLFNGQLEVLSVSSSLSS